MKVIDSHIHVQPWDMIKPGALAMIRGRRPDAAEIERLMRDPSLLGAWLDRERIEAVCIINYVSPDIMGFTEEANDYSASVARMHPGRVIAYGSVHPRLTSDAAGQMARLRDLGIRGIKIHPSHMLVYPNQYRQGLAALETIYARAQEFGMVVMIHTGTSVFPGARNVYADPIYVDDVALDFPELKIILAHGGRPLWMPTAMFLARRFANVYFDLSSLPPQNLLNYFPKLEELADKALWGSDWPAPGVPGMRANADRFLALPLSDSAKQKILFENAAKLYPVHS
jgi:predicted TIM-barrel fold metal-dependent hydrolase